MTKLSRFFAALLLVVGSTFAVAAPVNINTADADTIAEALNGVGPVKAKAIVDHRETHGLFETPEDLTKVHGIGEGILKKIRDDLVFE